MMWFKNLQLFRLQSPWPMELEALTEQLARGAFTPCPQNQPISRGWTPPRKDGGLVYGNNRQWLICLTVEQRLLPSSVIDEEVKTRANQIAEQQSYFPGKKQMSEIKERVAEELLPRAFTKKRRTYAWIDPQNGWLVIDAGSYAKADELIEHLRTCLNEFPLHPLRLQVGIVSSMAEWLASGTAPEGFTIDRDCELKACGEEKATVRYLHHDLIDETSPQIKDHLAAGKLPTRIALTWNSRLSFILTEGMDIKRLTFLDLIKEDAEKNQDAAADAFDADFALMTGELSRFLPQLIGALGGEEQPKEAKEGSAE